MFAGTEKEPVLQDTLLEQIEQIENQSAVPKETAESLLQLSMETEPPSEESHPEDMDQETIKQQLIECINQTSSRLSIKSE